jgi:hypothetical protein
MCSLGWVVPLPVRDSYRVADAFLAGGYPAAVDPAESFRRMRAFARYGVTRFVDLTHPADPLEPYEHWLDPGTSRISHPIVDMGTTTIPHMARILDDVDRALEDGATVYVHCWGGLGRTGTVVGCWLVRHGFDDPLGRIAELRRDLAEGSLASPQTVGQRAMVTRWKREQ